MRCLLADQVVALVLASALNPKYVQLYTPAQHHTSRLRDHRATLGSAGAVEGRAEKGA